MSYVLEWIQKFEPIATAQIWEDFRTQRIYGKVELPGDAPDDPAELDEQLAELCAAGLIEATSDEWSYVPQKPLVVERAKPTLFGMEDYE